jgi:hypothetical protein
MAVERCDFPDTTHADVCYDIFMYEHGTIDGVEIEHHVLYWSGVLAQYIKRWVKPYFDKGKYSWNPRNIFSLTDAVESFMEDFSETYFPVWHWVTEPTDAITCLQYITPHPQGYGIYDKHVDPDEDDRAFEIFHLQLYAASQNWSIETVNVDGEYVSKSYLRDDLKPEFVAWQKTFKDVYKTRIADVHPHEQVAEFIALLDRLALPEPIAVLKLEQIKHDKSKFSKELWLRFVWWAVCYMYGESGEYLADVTAEDFYSGGWDTSCTWEEKEVQWNINCWERAINFVYSLSWVNEWFETVEGNRIIRDLFSKAGRLVEQEKQRR